MVEPGSSEGWDAVLGDLESRRQASRAIGGEERLRKHREAGKLDARARIGPTRHTAETVPAARSDSRR